MPFILIDRPPSIVIESGIAAKKKINAISPAMERIIRILTILVKLSDIQKLPLSEKSVKLKM